MSISLVAGFSMPSMSKCFSSELRSVVALVVSPPLASLMVCDSA
jgi:hypothetical protein